MNSVLIANQFSFLEEQSSRAVQTAQSLRLPEILSALSLALDLTEGAIPGHAVRCTLLGIRIARAMGLNQTDQSALYYALQLKDIGCSSNAARMSQIFQGDDRAAKAMVKVSDWQGLFDPPQGSTYSQRLEHLGAGLRAVPSNMRALWSTVMPGASATEKIRLILELGRNTDVNTRELINLRCDRGAAILRKLEMNESACSAVRHLDEHWDGSGYPDRLRGREIPVLARIVAVAQSLDVFSLALGMSESIAVLKRRSGSWFDPEVVTVAWMLDELQALWKGCEPDAPPELTMQQVVAEAPDAPESLHAEQIDTICEVFADVVDAKSPFTARHSLGVAEVTRGLAEELGFGPGTVQHLARAALLHDLGKLGVSNRILDKPGALTREEMEIIWQHPGTGRTILARIAGFEHIAQLAGEHHEKLDGSGYPGRLSASQISVQTRLLTIADCFTALVESRPYRADMSVEAALSILKKDVPAKFDPHIFEALQALVRRWSTMPLSIFRESGVQPAYADCSLPAANPRHF